MERLLLNGAFSLAMPQSLLNLLDVMGLWGVSELSSASCSPPQPASLSLEAGAGEKRKDTVPRKLLVLGTVSIPEWRCTESTFARWSNLLQSRHWIGENTNGRPTQECVLLASGYLFREPGASNVSAELKATRPTSASCKAQSKVPLGPHQSSFCVC